MSKNSVEVVCLCRCGFEKEVAAEVSTRAAALGIAGFSKTTEHSGIVRFSVYTEGDVERLLLTCDFTDLVFIRHWFLLVGEFASIDTSDRVGPIKTLLLTHEACDDIQCVNVDTNEGKSLAKLTRGVAKHLENALKKQSHWQSNEQWTLQLLFLAGDHVLVGKAARRNISRWLGGIPRLKVPRSAPSRATLKLEEAWLHFVPQDEWDERLRPSMKAVDLGAAPGGWTWQLVNKSMFVDAVDNGPMNDDLMASGQVTHHLTDGFRYVPQKPVDWLVCDIADQPSKVAKMIARWAANAWFSEAVFNLKLPMKQRYAAVEDARELIVQQLNTQGIQYELRFKQLYHDREEVTGHLRLLS